MISLLLAFLPVSPSLPWEQDAGPPPSFLGGQVRPLAPAAVTFAHYFSDKALSGRGGDLSAGAKKEEVGPPRGGVHFMRPRILQKKRLLKKQNKNKKTYIIMM